ncbi:MAG: lysine exporter LysO family protein [Snodgrassella sp.]|uniref:lysine exporter LysO family protein n=1 Tax=Snodgrassella sp. TaxID=2815304 RepID=UPI0025893D25|nr:lysine exporter LysO family protein [Snodgrassella sp.]MCO6521801.1 lysine exporter LysO family protein [Snodgrassella sp.]
MQNLTSLLIILIPLLAGFCIPVPARVINWLNYGLAWLVYLILFLIGLSLAKIPSLGAQLANISLTVGVLFLCLIAANLLVFIWFDRRYPWHLNRQQPTGQSGDISIVGSLKQVGSLLVGLIAGNYLSFNWLGDPQAAVNKALLILLLLVGMQLRSSGITLQQVFLNRRGVISAGLFTFASLLGGLIFALIMPDVSISKGLALSSGYGWYSLSSIIMSKAYGAVWGSIALFNDLAREFFALIFIPILMRRYPTTAVSIGGATSLDFTLPAIQASGGITAVPLAISFGFIVNITAPILMVVFSSLGF